MTIFFTSDTHFGHANVIAHCHRPYASADEMDEALIARWNAMVAPGDTVYHLGDFCLRTDREAPWYLDRLNGTVHLVEGNHDGRTVKRHAACFASVSLIREISIAGQMIVLCHYPMREWNASYLGAWHLHGHTHGRLNHQPIGYSLDVGVDGSDFRPWPFEEIVEVMKTRDNPFGDGRRAPIKTTIRAPWPPENPGTP
jgi:calcineurin-like phosphoesterase family protein